MDAGELRAMQAPIKERYKSDPKTAFITLKAKGTLDDSNIACKVETGRALATALADREPLARPVHISGCRRRCGAPNHDHLDLVAPALDEALAGTGVPAHA